MDEFDVVVIGAGPAGEVCAEELRGAGLSVAIVEAELVGGTCAFYACMPSKALLRPEQLRRETERVPGVTGTAAKIDTGATLERRDQVIHGLDDEEQVAWLEEREIALYRGCAKLTGPKRLTVEEPGQNGEVVGSGGSGSIGPEHRQLAARRAVVIATGSGAAMPPIDGLDRVDAWNNRQGTTAAEAPDSLIVLGGGPVGCELAQAWSSLGSDVTLVEAAARLLPGEEPFASAELETAMNESGVDVLTGSEVSAVRREGGDVMADLSDGREISAAEILVAIGRRPRSEGLGLETFGLDGSGPIEVDGRMRVVGVGSKRDEEDGAERGDTGRAWLYAVGDVNGRVALTHVGKYQGRVAAADIIGTGGSGDDSRADGGGDAKDDVSGSEGDSHAVDGQAEGAESAARADAVAAGGPVVVALAEEFGAPRVTFTDPQVAAVGLTETEARRRGLELAIAEVGTSSTAGASFHGRGTAGTCRLIADTGTGLLVGATFVGFETAELLHAATVAIVGQVPIGRLRHALPAFPTRSEIWLDLLAQLP